MPPSHFFAALLMGVVGWVVIIWVAWLVWTALT